MESTHSYKTLNSITGVDLRVCSAIKKGYFSLVRFLLDLGVNPDERDNSGKTALSVCAFIDEERWAVGLVRTLLEMGAHAGYRDKYGLNAMHYACIYGRGSLVDVYINALDFDLNQGDRMGHTALFYAVTNGNVDITRKIVTTIRRFGLSVDRPNKNGVTPLIQAWKCGEFDCAEILVREGEADEEAMDNMDCKTAKQWEERAKEKRAREMLVPARIRGGLLRSRAKTAPPSGRHLSVVQNDSEVDSQTPPKMLPMRADMSKVIRRAKDNDARNDPAYVLNLTPIDCFVVDKYNQATPSILNMSTGYHEMPGISWRHQFKDWYKHLQLQCSPSYREVLRQKGALQAGDHMERPSSPSMSESTSIFSDRASSVRFPASKHRRGSNVVAKMAIMAAENAKKSQRSLDRDHGRERPTSGRHDSKRKTTNVLRLT